MNPNLYLVISSSAIAALAYRLSKTNLRLKLHRMTLRSTDAALQAAWNALTDEQRDALIPAFELAMPGYVNLLNNDQLAN